MMQRLNRLIRLSGAALVAGALAIGASPPAPAGDLTVAMDGLRSTKGVVRLCLTRNASHFPDCKDDPAAIADSFPAAAGARAYARLPVGTWAVSAVHDENGNARLDTLAGIPREGVGFSRNPRLGMGAPRFDSAAFHHGTDGSTQTIRLRYFL